MTVFLAVVDRQAAGDPSEFQSAVRLRELLSRTAQSYDQFLGSDYERDPVMQPATKRQDVHVLIWNRKNSAPSLASNGKYWAISSGHQVASKLIDNVRPLGNSLVYSQPVWGNYATVWGVHDKSHIYAWNTSPALESVHWGSTSDYIVMSNRPLLAAFYLAHAQANGSPGLSPDYLPEYLYYGYSITGQTPFKDVRTLSVNSALFIHDGAVSLTPIPNGLNSSLGHDHTLDEGAQALASALTSAMDRTEDDLAGRPLQLRLSGGKDSRLLLALLRGRNLTYRVVTFGKPEDVDVKLASSLCKMAGVSGEVRSPRPAHGEFISDRITSTLRESGGMPASEPHTAQYRGADPEKPREAIMLGQWPLYKGGMARNLAASPTTIHRVLREQGSPLVSPSVRQIFDTHLLGWAEQLSITEDIEKLYLFAREFRSGRYLHAHISQYAASSLIAYPIADAEVTAVCDALSMSDKVNERALFLALQKLWPEVMKVPLDRSLWKFERNGKDSELSGPWYEARKRPAPQTPPSKLTEVKAVIPEYSDAAAVELAQHVVRSDYYPEIAHYLSESTLTAIAHAASGDIVLPDKSTPRKGFIKFLWRLAVAERWLSREWLDC